MRTRLVLLVVVVALLVPAFARANDKTYPITSFTDWLGGPRQDLSDPAVGTYSLEAGFVDGVNRILRESKAHSGDDPSQKIQELYDSLLHMRPDAPYTHISDAGDVRYSPDWNHDGVFGDTASSSPNNVGDFDVDVDSVQDTAYFRYPCLSAADGWALHYVYEDGTCDTKNAKAQAYRLGVVREVKVIGSRGLVIDATLWIPSAAFKSGACPAFKSADYSSSARWQGCVQPSSLSDTSFPAIVFNDGLASIQQHYYYLAERLVASGYIVVTYDPIGQGRSEGSITDLLALNIPRKPQCSLTGSCIDVQDMMRWFTGSSIVRIQDNGHRFAPRQDPARNVPNPVLPIVDTSSIGMAGHSMGAIATLSYAQNLGAGTSVDGRALPRIQAALPFSGAHPTRAVVPIEFVTSDYDGSPTTILPGVFGVNLGGRGEGIGYRLIKQTYDAVRRTHDPAPVALSVLEGGVHIDFADEPPLFRTTWSLGMAGSIALDWFDCWVKGSAAACTRTHEPQEHLSKVFATEMDADGPAGPDPSRCIVVPTEAALSQQPKDFVEAETGHPVYNCTP
jgi:dienelactone hydrolase